MKTEMFDNVSREKNCLVWVCIASGSAGNGCKCIQGGVGLRVIVYSIVALFMLIHTHYVYYT